MRGKEIAKEVDTGVNLKTRAASSVTYACLDAVLDAMPDAALVLDQTGAIILSNTIANEMFGLSESAIVGKPIESLFNGKGGRALLAYIQASHSREQEPSTSKIPIKLFIRSRRNKRIPVEIFTARTRQQKLRALIIRDISKQEKEQELRERLASIVEHSNDAIFGRRIDGSVNSWNKAAERIFGYSAAEIVGYSSSVLLPPEKADETKKVLQRVRNGERIEHFRTKRLRKDGRVIDVSLTISPIRSSTGRIVGASTIARDITEKMRLQEEVLQISEREQLRVGRDLHDGLGQQLTGLALLCRRLRDRLREGSFAEARDAGRLVQHLDASIEQTRALAHGLSPVLETPDGLMIALQDLARRTEELSGISCIFECNSPVLLRDHATAIHLYRIAQEAVSNALRHGKAKRIHVELSRGRNRIRLSVEDNGCGIKQDARRAAGLGLNIMKYRAGIIGGQLSIGPGQRQGTRVACVLPGRGPNSR